MKSIVLTTLNAKYTHTALSLRYLYANLKELKSVATIQEHIITDNLSNVAEKILLSDPTIVGISVYIWNASEIHRLIKIIKKISPETIVILGGPEVSYSPFRVNFDLADYIVQGEGERSFYSLCRDLIDNKTPKNKIIKSDNVDLKTIELPYDHYTDEDVLNRVIYIEFSRGCLFDCEFCLSSIDESVREFNIDLVLAHVERLWERGVRKFKFIDRTFNLNINSANYILDHFLRKQPPYLIHCEVVPEHFPKSLKDRLRQFPPAAIQLEIGVQTLNSKTAENIGRRSNFKKIKQNLSFLSNETNAHLHLDLIIGLPGEGIKGFSENLNLLTSLVGSEVQIGILKKLSGTSISRHDEEYGMVYSDEPPYEILQNHLITFESMQKLKRFSRFWDLVYNSGNFKNISRLLWEEGKAFEGFYSFSEWAYKETQTTWRISLDRLSCLIFEYLVRVKKQDRTIVADIIAKDLLLLQGRELPGFLKRYISFIPKKAEFRTLKINRRQMKHF